MESHVVPQIRIALCALAACAAPRAPFLQTIAVERAADGATIVTAGDGTEIDHFYVNGTPVGPPGVQASIWSEDRTTCVFAVAKTATSELWIGDPRRNPRRFFAREGVWLPRAIEATRVIAVHEVAPYLEETFAIDLATGAATQLAPLAYAGDDDPIGDGIPTIVHRPRGVLHAPVLLQLHGGPEDRWTAEPDGRVLALVARGYAIVRPNVRGSVGYGRAWLEADDREHRERAIDDVIGILDWIATRPEFDASRVVIEGSSYGGFLALAVALREQTRLRGVIVRYGIVDLAGFLAGTAPTHRDQRRHEYGDERDPATRARLDALSPARTIEMLRIPLFVAHGRLDPRVPIIDVERMLARLPAAHAFIVADEGHLFARPETIANLDRAVDAFVDDVMSRR